LEEIATPKEMNIMDGRTVNEPSNPRVFSRTAQREGRRKGRESVKNTKV